MSSQFPKIPYLGSMIEGVQTFFHKNFDEERPLVFKPEDSSTTRNGSCSTSYRSSITSPQYS